MYNEEILKELKRLNFEDIVWLFYGSIIIFNIFGNYYEKIYLKTNSKMVGESIILFLKLF